MNDWAVAKLTDVNVSAAGVTVKLPSVTCVMTSEPPGDEGREKE